MVISNLLNKLNFRPTPTKELNEAIIPVFGIRWDIHVIRRVGARKLRHILCLLRNSDLSGPECSRICQLWKNGAAGKADFLIDRERWRSLIERFNLNGEILIIEWFLAVATCIKLNWKEPSQLASDDALTLNSVIAWRDLKIGTFQLWRACVLSFVDTSAGAALMLKGASSDAETLPTRLKSVSLADSAIRKDVPILWRKWSSRNPFRN